ncbi:unnamed protein product, partial [Prorocentrum cordatum]
MEELRVSMEALNARLQAQENVVQQLQGERQQLQQELQQARQAPRVEPAPPPSGMVDTRVIGKPGEFAGDVTKFADWSFKMKSYFGAVDHRYQGKLMEAEQSQVTIRNATMEPDCHNAGVNEGFEAWRQFVLEWGPKLRSRFVGLRMQAMAYKFTGDIPSALAAFERLVRDYESQSNKKIDDDDKIGVVLLGMEDSRVKQHLIRNSAGLDTWPKMREEILEITRAQQYVDSQPTPMLLGAIPRGGKDPKGGRPKGGRDPKGPGKKGKDKGGKADGGKNQNVEKECFYCRKKGHVKAESRKRQRDLAAAENRRGPPDTARTATVGAAAEPAHVDLRPLGALPTAAASSGSAAAILVRDTDRPVPVLAATRTDTKYLMIDTCAGASVFPRGLGPAAEDDSPVGPVRLATATDDPVVGDNGKQPRFGLQDGRQVTVRYNEAEVKFPIVSVGEAAGQGTWFLFGPGHQVMLPSEASPDLERISQLPNAVNLEKHRGVQQAPVQAPAQEPEQEARASGSGLGAGSPAPAQLRESEESRAVSHEKLPPEVSKFEFDTHQITHLPFRSWCPHCVVGKASDDAHHPRPDATKGEARFAMDYFFLVRAVDPQRLKSVLNCLDMLSGAVFAAMVALKYTGRARVAILCDQGNAVKKLADDVRDSRAHETSLLNTPKGSSASDGGIERANYEVEKQLRTLRSRFEQCYNLTVGLEHKILPFMVRHAAWLLTHFQVKADGAEDPEYPNLDVPSGFRAAAELDNSEWTQQIIDWGRTYYGVKSGKALDKQKVYEGRVRELENMERLGVVGPISIADARSLGLEIVYSKWLEDEKPTAEDEKAVRCRLVATQVNTYNREDVAQATPPIKASRMIVSMAATKTNAKGQRDWLIGRHDIQVAFFHAAGSGKVVIIPPRGLAPPGVGWRALKAMCGAREASKCWGNEVTDTMKLEGARQVVVVPMMFVYDSFGYVTCCHGDDFLTAGAASTLDEIDRVLTNNFDAKILPRLGPPAHGGEVAEGQHLGGAIRWTPEGFEWEANPKHRGDLLSLAGLNKDPKGAPTPSSKSTAAGRRDRDDDMEGKAATSFKQGAGAALYLSIDRPTIQFATSQVMAGMGMPKVLHGLQLQRVTRYVLKHPTEVWLFRCQKEPGGLCVYTVWHLAIKELWVQEALRNKEFELAIVDALLNWGDIGAK